ncbi:DUF2336 domain-containing protein [Sphingobium boeckii]|uniref:Uncharacterized protein (DUF2336 family) n=1 Tax=Sphingobium boeckii TaxID=1082345 RepID=A0A7W9AGS8_9SPHN|nr:DUF2336 domain-containing protein [Sphingobium boeckii]MBB5685096.1 uncharacterized protein (DUF2336 family) [Sphingobium boeckii]
MFADDDDGSAAQPIGAERLLADAARAAHGARKRLASLVDLFLPETMRLNDYQRVTVRHFLTRLVAAVESDLRQHIVAADSPHFSAELLTALGSMRVSLAMPVLDRARALHDVELVSLLLARVEEQRISQMLRRNDFEPESRLVETLLSDEDPEVAIAAMALLIAESRRLYMFDEPTLLRTDLPADLHYRLVWWVAAALREYMVRQHRAEPGAVDAALMDAAGASLSMHDEGETLEAASMQLVYQLSDRGVLNDMMLKAACLEGRLSLFVAMLAVRGGIDFESARGMALPPYGDRLVVLLRALDVGREAAASIMMAIGTDDAAVVEQIDAYETLDRVHAMEAIRPWQIDNGYRTAITALAAGLAERRDGWA